MYLVVKQLHIFCVVLSICFFTYRACWMLWAPELLNQRWVRVAPQIIDSLLLISAITVASLIQQYPFSADWLTAKLLALIAYIVLGTIALRRGRTRAIRCTALVSALLLVGYIIWVAKTHHPLPWQR